MENWLAKVLTDVSNRHKIGDNKARLLLNKLIDIIFKNSGKPNKDEYLRGEKHGGVK